ncbi:MAG: TetR/AcrR family transcriptional regulator [Acidimicrobiales bacterium]
MSSEVPTYGDPDTRQRILAATWSLVSERGAGFKLRDVAQTSGVSRQAVYLHFGDRAGLLVGLVQHMDDVLDLGASLSHVFEAPTSSELLQRAMRLNTEFWDTVAPVAQVLEAAQHDDQAITAAWRDRMRLRQQVFGMMIQRIADNGQLATGWTIDRGAAMLYAVAGFEPWRELTRELGWDHDTYVEEMTRILTRAMLS